MELREPKSMDEIVYFTRRVLDDDGKARVWVFKELCDKCGKALMEKPRDEKTGKSKIRAKEYVCSECGNTVDKKEYEESLIANVEYTCPKCKFHGKLQIPFKRKSVKGVKSLVFECEKCKNKILITKKMKEV